MTIDSFVIDGTARAVSGIAHAMTDPLFVWPLGIALGLAGVCGLMRLLQVRPARAEAAPVSIRIKADTKLSEVTAGQRVTIARSLLTDALPQLVHGRVSSRCPFHSERTPGGAFFYDPESDWGHCHSCGKGGDIVNIFNVVRGNASDDPLGVTDLAGMVTKMFPLQSDDRAFEKRLRVIPFDAEGLLQFAEAVHVMSGDIIRNGCDDAARVRRFGDTCAVAATLARRNAEGV